MTARSTQARNTGDSRRFFARLLMGAIGFFLLPVNSADLLFDPPEHKLAALLWCLIGLASAVYALGAWVPRELSKQIAVDPRGSDRSLRWVAMANAVFAIFLATGALVWTTGATTEDILPGIFFYLCWAAALGLYAVTGWNPVAWSRTRRTRARAAAMGDEEPPA